MKLSNFTQGRDNNFNLIRMFAALGVIISHSFPMTGVPAEPIKELSGITLGSMAVHVFFVTSGFLVTASIINRKSVVEYACARGLRIYPAAIAMVAVTVFLFGTCFTNLPLRSYFANHLTHVYIIKNCTFVAGSEQKLPGVFQHNPGKDGMNGPLWSIPFELRMYALLAAFWIIFRSFRSSKRNLFNFAIIALVAVTAVFRTVGHFCFLSDDGYPELLLMFFSGALFYILREQIELSARVFWVLAVILLLSLVQKDLFFVVYNFSLPYLLFFLAYVPGGFLRNYNRLGDYSYGTYIYGFPIQQSVVALFPRVSWWQSVLISFPVILIFAALSWHLLEKKALAQKSVVVERVRSHWRRRVGVGFNEI